MIHYECDQCGVNLGANDEGRFIVKIEVYAAAGPVEFRRDELAEDHSGEIQGLIHRLSDADPDEIEDQTYRCLRFDLCAACQKQFLRQPLGDGTVM